MRTILLVAAACLTGHAAFAHAFLDRAVPPVGSEISTAPSVVTLTFSEATEPRFSAIHVTDAAGARVETSNPVAGDHGHTLSVGLKPLPSGVYTVEWRAMSVDTHKSEGHFSFTVKP